MSEMACSPLHQPVARVFVLFRDIDYEGSHILMVCLDEKDARDRLKFLETNKHELAYVTTFREGRLWRWWASEYGDQRPGDSYHIEEHRVRLPNPSDQRTPAND